MSALVSIIITNFNYGAYVAAAIDSALAQTYPHVEVIVVDDGSSDDSRAVITRYRGRVCEVYKANGGQASAFNAGFVQSRGDVVLFLDADDLLLPSAAETAEQRLRDPAVPKVHWRLEVCTADGAPTGRLIPNDPLPDGELRDVLLRDGPTICGGPPTSGNAWARSYLRRVMPIPEHDFRLAADAYLLALALLFGRVERVDHPLSLYRGHGENNYWGKPMERSIEQGVEMWERQAAAVATVAGEMRFPVDVSHWRKRSWWHQLRRAVAEVRETVPRGSSFILIDGDEWGSDEDWDGRRRIPFTEHQGRYWGDPADDEEAIAELDRLRRRGAGYLVLAWPAFWWEEQYVNFLSHVRGTFRCVCHTPRLVAFDIRSTANARGSRNVVEFPPQVGPSVG